MFGVAVLVYGLLVSFVLLSMRRNEVGMRPHPQIVLAFGWGLMSFSWAMGGLLASLAIFRAVNANLLTF